MVDDLDDTSVSAADSRLRTDLHTLTDPQAAIGGDRQEQLDIGRVEFDHRHHGLLLVAILAGRERAFRHDAVGWHALGSFDEASMSDPDEVAGLVRDVVELSNTASVAELTVNCAFEPTY